MNHKPTQQQNQDKTDTPQKPTKIFPNKPRMVKPLLKSFSYFKHLLQPLQ